MAVNNPSNPTSRKAILDALQEMNDSMVRKAAETALQKSIVDRIAEEHELDKKIFRKMAKTFHKDSFNVEVNEAEDFTHLYEIIVGVTTAPTGEDDDNYN